MAKTESRTELGGSPELPANVGGGVVLRLRRAVHMGHGTTLPQSSPQLVQAAFAVIRPLQSLLPLQHPMSVSGAGLFSSQTLGTCCGLAGGLPAEMGVEEQM